ncbi:PAS domain-containing protein [Candidatus Reidiella endopervernicosa]|uniref:PAS domain S-box protein n=1 Tax=Candidatus Reidiella endopervernicosa TaxID=2738883 RepID=A0A6N0HYE2_9GAMM|nr:PAS domain-containing protein [Candidatus Reidiella endopervernicosa]QKQ27349.1 PAS domain S-box protein [Candidatus Reidiella endopervernicosa]
MFITAVADTLAGIIRRKKTEDKLKQAATVFESAAEGIVITDEQARITAVNQTVVAMTGYSENEMLGKTPASGVQSTMIVTFS